jgi:uncharacterized protein (DUF885 family)
MKKTFLFLIVLILAFGAIQCTNNTTENNNSPTASSSNTSGDKPCKEILESYVVEFLKRNPTVNTYLGGAGLKPELKEVDGKLRDHSITALETEDKWLKETQEKLEKVDPKSLSTTIQIDRDVALAQIRFLLHQHQIRKYQQRALDTYTDEPFRAIDWQLQGMTQTGDKTYGTVEEWNLVINRVNDVPRFLKVAQQQLDEGVKFGNTADWRMLKRNGIDTSEADAKYFESELPKIATERIAASPERDELLKKLADSTKVAAAAYRDLKAYVAKTFFDDPNSKDETGLKAAFKGPRYMMGTEEYNWALKNNLKIEKTANQLYEEAFPIVQATQEEMIKLAREIGQKRNLKLPENGSAAVRAIFDELAKDYPKNDAEMIGWYKDAAFRLVEYSRKTGVFDVPTDYKLEVVETPPPLQASIDGASYYPAPPFKNSGVGRFYVSPTGNDIAKLKDNNRSSIADLSAHEGFPGHDWNYKVMTKYRDRIAPVRWLTPGAVEDSSSMWQDSMASEGWALYSEALMAEPQKDAPNGFYTPEERLYQLQGKLYRDLRVRVDTGIHTGRIKYEEAVDLFSEIVNFLPGSCSSAEALKNPDKRASCDSAEKAIFRYSKWPTQAITYRLGKDQIFELRAEANKLLGDKFSAKDFHILFMQYGTIPPPYFRAELLRELKEKAK